MHKFNNNQVPNIFYDIIKKPQHKYPVKFLSNSFCIKKYFLNCTEFSISLSGRCCGMMFFIKKKRIFNLIHFFRVNLHYIRLKIKPITSETIAISF